MTNCKGNPPKEWDMAHLSEGQYDGARSGFGRYFEDKDYYSAGWYAKGMFNGYVIDHQSSKGTKKGVQNLNPKAEVTP